MRIFYLIAGIAVLSFAACQADPKEKVSTKEETTTTVTETETDNPDDWVEVDSIPGRRTMFETTEKPEPGIVGPRTPQVDRVVKVLTSGYFYCDAYMKINDEEAYKNNRGIWFKFEPDFSYTSGKWDKVTGGGKWSFTGKDAILHLDAGTDLKSGEYKVMISKDEQIVIMVGTPRYLQNNMQMKTVHRSRMVTEEEGL